MNKILVSVCLAVSLSACQLGYRHTSPDVVYSEVSAKAAPLQVPPDLNSVTDGEQFVLPGSAGGAVARNTLLPEFNSIEFVREADQSWLEIASAPEDVWPRLLAFARHEKYKVEQTQPVSGVIVTQWREAGKEEGGGLLKNLIGGNAAMTRVAFRLERAGRGTRLFTRVQVAAADEVNADVSWPAESYYPENTNTLLSNLLVFLGVDEQKASGILSTAQASNVLDDAVVQSTGSGDLLVVHRGYEPSFDAIEAALEQLDYRIIGSDSSVGQIRIESVESGYQMVVTVVPVHISAVRVSLQPAESDTASTISPSDILERLRVALA